ncbi:MAG: response regulator [Gemmatimonadaceae bacterium]
MKILLVEDDPVTREIVKRMLTRIADTVIEAGDGLEALELIEREDPDFVFTDLHMPVMDGYNLVKAIRASPQWAALPIVCLSGIRDRAEVMKLLDLGIADYILKPIRPQSAHDRFRAVVAQHSGWRRTQRVGDRRTMLLVDSDPNFRTFAKNLLEIDFEVQESISGSDAARKYQQASPKPDVVLIADGLKLLSETQLAEMIRRFASDARVSPPTMLLMSESDDLPAEKIKRFAAVIKRSFVPGEFELEVRRWLFKAESPFEKLTTHIENDARDWFSTGVRQTLGVMAGSDASVVTSMAKAKVTGGVAATVKLESPTIGGGLVVHIASPREDATRIGAAVLRRDEVSENEPAEVFAELINVIGGRVRASLEQHGWDLRLSLPEVDNAYSSGEESWSLSSWFKTTAGDAFQVGLRLYATAGAAAAPSLPDTGSAPAGEPATPSADGADEVADALF